MREKWFVSAIINYTKAIVAEGKSPKLILKRDQCCIELVELALAERDCQKALTLDVNHAQPYSMLKKIYETQGLVRAQEIITRCDDIIESNADIKQKYAALRLKSEIIPLIYANSTSELPNSSRPLDSSSTNRIAP